MFPINSPAAIAVGVSLLGFVIVKLIGSSPISPELPFAAGLLIGGIITPLFTKKSNDASEEEAEQQSKTIYVGNLPYKANEQEVRKLFAQYGSVLSVRLLKDRQTGKRRGFGFVEMPNADADKAIASLNEVEFLQRKLKVREAKDRQGDEGLQSND